MDYGFPSSDAVPPGWKPRLYVSQDGRCYNRRQALGTPGMAGLPDFSRSQRIDKQA
jgi:hypothetical protein